MPAPQPKTPSSRRRALLLALAAAAGYAAVSLFDRAIFFALRWQAAPGARPLEAREWYQALRQVGYLPVWILIGSAIVLYDARVARDAGRVGGPAAPSFAVARRGAVLALGAAVSGAAAELLKRLIGRERPVGADGEFQGYVYRPLFDGFRDGSNLGLPSSHAAVAFGAAFVLMRLFPGAWPAFLIAAGGCALTRLLAGAHFASDVYLAIVVAYACSAGLCRALRPAP
jgi:membrane-associated phospholipid phosphatase